MSLPSFSRLHSPEVVKVARLMERCVRPAGVGGWMTWLPEIEGQTDTHTVKRLLPERGRPVPDMNYAHSRRRAAAAPWGWLWWRAE